jgi:hypothetical protein
MFIKGIDVTTDIAKTTNSVIANFCVVFTIFFSPLQCFIGWPIFAEIASLIHSKERLFHIKI